jgi:integrase
MLARINNALLATLTPRASPYEINDTELKGFLLRVQPSGIGTYWCTYRNRAGQRHRLNLGRLGTVTPAQARDHARRALASVVHGEDPANRPRPIKEHTLRSFLDEDYAPWVQTHRKTGSASVARIEACFRGFLDLKLADITPQRVERWRSKRLEEESKPASVNRDASALRSALTKAVEWGQIADHPLRALKPLKLDNSRIVRYLTDDEERRLLKALDTREEGLRRGRDNANQWRRERDYAELPNLYKVPYADHLKPMVLVSINTGIRQGELFQLRWADVDLQRADLAIEGSNAKSGKTRHISLNEYALAAFKNWQKQQPEDADLVFPAPTGGRFDNVAKAWKGVLATAKIEKFRWHDLRHHFASRLVMEGVALNTVRHLLGHSDLDMTLRYAHLAPEHTAAAVAKLVRQPLPEYALAA